MKNLILLFISFLMISISGNAQDILDGAYDRKTTYENRKVQPYPHLRQADVMWSRKIWREIDLREKVNHPFYYPAVAPGQETVNDRKSLIDVVMNAILEGSIIAYGNAVYDDEFKTPMTQEEIDAIQDQIEQEQAAGDIKPDEEQWGEYDPSKDRPDKKVISG